jgi:hypothetical protein
MPLKAAVRLEDSRKALRGEYRRLISGRASWQELLGRERWLGPCRTSPDLGTFADDLLSNFRQTHESVTTGKLLNVQYASAHFKGSGGWAHS